MLTRQSMASDIDIMHGHGPSNEMHYQLQPKKAVLAINMVVKGVIHAVYC